MAGYIQRVISVLCCISTVHCKPLSRSNIVQKMNNIGTLKLMDTTIIKIIIEMCLRCCFLSRFSKKN